MMEAVLVIGFIVAGILLNSIDNNLDDILAELKKQRKR